tara:strand:+ start:1014 stop:2093 length:1080 start_codon:yes stop_codon:yes gene_type:complete
MASASDKNKKTKSGVKKAAKETSAAAKTAAPKKTAAKKTAVKKPAGKKAAPKKSVAKKPSAKKPAAKKAAAKKTVEKKAAVKKKNISKKTATPKKSAPKKAAVKKAAPKKATSKKAAPKKAAPKKAVAKKVAPKKTTTSKQEPPPEVIGNSNIGMLFLAGLALMAFLSFTVFNAGRDGDIIQNERNLMIASQLVQYGVAAAKKVKALQESGVALSDINFDPAAAEDDETALYAPAGGGMIYEEPLGTGGRRTAWKVLGISDARDGFLVSGLGSDAAVRGREIILYFEGLDPEVCSQMRKGWGLDPEIPVQEVKLDFDHRAAIRAGANATTFYATPGRAFSCFRNGRKGPYIYYQALAIQ